MTIHSFFLLYLLLFSWLLCFTNTEYPNDLHDNSSILLCLVLLLSRISNIQDILDISIDAVFGKDNEFDTLEDVSDSDGYISEVSDLVMLKHTFY